MKKWMFAGLIVLCVSAIATRLTLADGDHDSKAALRATLLGAHEVPPNNTEGTARFRAAIHDDDTITFELTYADLSTNPTQSHIHFGQFNVNGGVMIWLCGGPQPACPPATSGTIEGTITPADVTGPANQGINVGDLASALRVIKDGEGYANLHTTKFPGGEIRGQVKGRHDNN